MGFDGSLRPRGGNPNITYVRTHGFTHPPASANGMQIPVRQPQMHMVNVPPPNVTAPPQQPFTAPHPIQPPTIITPERQIDSPNSPVDEQTTEMEMEETAKAKPEPTMCERMNFLRENDILCDVEVVVGMPPNTTTFKAHRCILAAGSKGFEELFIGNGPSQPPPMKKRRESGAEGTNEVTIVEVPDVSPEAFRAILEYLYSDFLPESISIPNFCVLDTLNAARRYRIPQLEVACVDMLGDISPSLAVTLLEQARRFGSTELIRRCFEVIDERTDDALAADGFAELDKETLKLIIERSELAPSDELSVFRAACNWADAECKRQSLLQTPKDKRIVLDDLFYCIRFPTMSVEEFSEAANYGLLTDEEIGTIFRYISSPLRSSITLPFPVFERRCLGRSKHVVKRFIVLSKNSCKKQRSTIWFIVNREILITALGIYGVIHSNDAFDSSNEWQTTVHIEIGYPGKLGENKEQATVTLRGVYGDVRPVLARFKKPVRIAPNVPHRATIIFPEEIETYAGAKGAEDLCVHIGGDASMQECGSSDATGKAGTPPVGDATNVVHFAFHNDDPNGIRRGMTRGPAVYSGAIGGFYNRPTTRVPPLASEGCLYEGQIPEIYFLVPKTAKKECPE